MTTFFFLMLSDFIKGKIGERVFSALIVRSVQQQHMRICVVVPRLAYRKKCRTTGAPGLPRNIKEEESVTVKEEMEDA